MPRVERQIIGIFGRINAGKSTLMNLLTQQDTSIVDAAPGTTTDIKSAIMEIHDLGPVQLLDTAGLDEESNLGAKKKKKTIAALEEVDLAVLVIDPVQSFLSGGMYVEDRVSTLARKLGKFLLFLDSLSTDQGVQLVLTDSQAIDIMSSWVPQDVPLTTFSIMMINITSGGNLHFFAEGAEVLNSIKSGDRILIVEACNHDRISEDIGTVQIPQKLGRVCPGIRIDHSFGREFPGPEELSEYRLIIHCGGCMISSQKLSSRVLRLSEAGVPVTNYGVVLSWLEGSDTLERVLRPWIEKGP